jgi:hypothetical protein
MSKTGFKFSGIFISLNGDFFLRINWAFIHVFVEFKDGNTGFFFSF